jgi:exopolysaccharide/PEP-CTERM locus tyrosine autokinase
MSARKNDSHKSTAAINLAAAREMVAPVNTVIDAADPDYDAPAGGGGSGITPEAVMLLDRLRDMEMLVPGSNLGPEIKNEYRRIKRPLLSNAFGKTASLVDQGNLIAVTSSVPGEGKTFTAVNLALAFAQERDNTVLLIDCDVTKQGVSRMFGVERRRPDFTDLLAGEDLSVGDALLRTDVPGLVLLPAGKPHEYITEMVASQRMARLVHEIATRYNDRIIIFDSPPLLATPEAQVIAGLVGQIVFVIEAGKTPHSIVEDALEMLPKDKAIGLVLNKSESLSNRGSYYYNYYAPYGEKEE